MPNPTPEKIQALVVAAQQLSESVAHLAQADEARDVAQSTRDNAEAQLVTKTDDYNAAVDDATSAKATLDAALADVVG